MKNLKTKLMSAVAMLTVSAVMLVGTSFAWYTLSTNPEVTNIKATAVANENLEIALVKELDTTDGSIQTTESTIDRDSAFNGGAQGSATGNNYTWGNLIDMDGIITGAELRPATSGTNGLEAPRYGDDGRAKELVGLTDGTAYTSDKEGWVPVYGTPRITSGENTIETGLGADTKYAFRVDYVLRTNKAGVISLATASVRDKTNNAGTGSGSYVDRLNGKPDSIKVYFKITPQAGDGTWNTASSYFVEADNTAGTGTGESGNGVAVGKDKLTATLIGARNEQGIVTATATANAAYLVQMYVYLNGQVVTNEDAGTAINDLAVNVQFENSAISNTGAMKK